MLKDIKGQLFWSLEKFKCLKMHGSPDQFGIFMYKSL